MLPDDPDSQARLFYLMLLGCFIAVGVFSQYRRRLSQAMQHAAIWVLIFMGAVLLVGFAEPLKRQLFESDTMQVDRQTVALRRGTDGHFYATLEVNGSNLRFLVDTGASDIVLSKRDAQRAGIETDQLDFFGSASTANGTVRIAPVRLESVRLGDFEDQNVRATVNGGELDISLLGMSYLDRYSGFEVNGDQLLLRR